jgi:hypothetical protein
MPTDTKCATGTARATYPTRNLLISNWIYSAVATFSTVTAVTAANTTNSREI